MNHQHFDHATVTATNIGGIDRTTVSLEPPVTVLVGKNATNRTSFLRALMGALGSDRVSLKGDADQGEIELDVGGETYARRLSRTDGGVITEGDPYLEDPEAADLFAFLLEMNDARQVVSSDGDLRDLIMRPVDTDAITAEIERLEGESKDVSSRIDDLERTRADLPDLEQRRTTIRSQIDEKESALEEIQAEIDDVDADPEEMTAERRALETKLDELGEQRSKLEGLRYELETERESLESTRREYADVEAELADLPDDPVRDRSTLEAELSSLRDRKRTIDSTVNTLQTLAGFNEEMLTGGTGLQEFRADSSTSEQTSLTDQLLEDDETGVCWTCGSDVDRTQLTETLEELRGVIDEKREESSEIRRNIRELETALKELEDHEQKGSRLRTRLDRLEDEVERRERTIEELEDETTEKRRRIEKLEDEVESIEEPGNDRLLELHREANRLEFELGQLQDDLESVNRELSEKTSRVERLDDLRARQEEIKTELTDLRTKIEQLERGAVDSFNHHMDALLDLLEYENLERIWLDRTERTVREGRRRKTKTVFDLHVIRTTDSGVNYEDSIEHLSESEREVTGLVVALAGYLVHELHEEVPFMILDSLEAIDSNRIATLIEYFEEYAPYIVVSLLPEDADALDDSYHRVTEI